LTRPLLYILRSAGSKCWFLPYIRSFLGDWTPRTVVEPFAGSGVAGLTLLDEGYTKRLVLAEKDPALREFWQAGLNDPTFSQRVGAWTEQALSLPLAAQRDFTLASIAEFERSDKAFWILLMTRTKFNAVLKGGFKIHDVRGILTNWPPNLASSLERLYVLRERIDLFEDGLKALEYANSPDNYAFVDPPYSASKNSPGWQFYAQNELDHQALLKTLAAWKGQWQLTYDISLETFKPLTTIIRSEVTVLRDESGQIIAEYEKQTETSDGILFRMPGLEWTFVEMLSGGRGATRKKMELVIQRSHATGIAVG